MPQKNINVTTDKCKKLYDITREVEKYIKECNINSGIINVYARGATAAVLIQENWDESVQNDLISLLQHLIPNGVWEHDKQDHNGDSHLKAGIIGPSENIPIIDKKSGLSTWQNIFFCEFDGHAQTVKLSSP